VAAEFERYLACGILANGFARVRCADCAEEILVAFSCKGRGICPSCTTRRMQSTALYLTDRVLPHAPIRQWVLSLPRWARFLLARDAQLITRTLDVALRAIFAWQRRRARKAGARAPQTGAVTFVQRFGGSLNLNVHFHSVIPECSTASPCACAASYVLDSRQLERTHGLPTRWAPRKPSRSASLSARHPTPGAPNSRPHIAKASRSMPVCICTPTIARDSLTYAATGPDRR